MSLHRNITNIRHSKKKNPIFSNRVLANQNQLLIELITNWHGPFLRPRQSLAQLLALQIVCLVS